MLELPNRKFQIDAEPMGQLEIGASSSNAATHGRASVIRQASPQTENRVRRVSSKPNRSAQRSTAFVRRLCLFLADIPASLAPPRTLDDYRLFQISEKRPHLAGFLTRALEVFSLGKDKPPDSSSPGNAGESTSS